MSDGRTITRGEAFRTLCLSRWRQFYREPEVIFWSFVFPIALAVALGVAFRSKPVEVIKVAVTPDAAALVQRLASTPQVHTVTLSEDEAARALRQGRVG